MTEPLADLHRHIDGSLRAETINELAEEVRRRVPYRLKFYAGMGLEEALSKFEFMLAILQTPDAVKRVTSEICEDAAADGVTTLELRFAPQLHRGADPGEIVDAAVEGAAGRAGIILCGLFGESPDVLNTLVEIAKDRPGVVGIDLAGGPKPTDRWIVEDYAKAFTRAKDLGIGRTVHAGEGRPPDEIAIAIETLHAQRIGHGTTLLDEPVVLEMILEDGITIEACPSSNVHTGCIGSVAEHPLLKWIERGVKVCVNTDNTFFSDVTASAELANVKQIPGVTAEHLSYLVKCGHEAAFRRA